MKCKYKKFLKAAYINYEEDYCGHRSGAFTNPTVTTPIIVITGTTAIIACAISGATIYYTLDGSTPTSSSTQYTGTITLTQSCTIKAIAVKPGMSDSAVASESYVHYLTQWKIVGNSEVHTDPYLTSWKVSGNSEVHNLPYTDIPSGYTKCKYLSFNNGQYFDSGILTSNDIGIRVKFATSAQRNTMIGARKSFSSSAYLFGYFDNDGNTVYVGYGGYSRSVPLTKSYIDGNTHTLILDSTQAKIDNEDISFTRGTGTEFFNILIGAWNNNGAVDSVNAKYNGKIEEVKIYNSNQTLGNFIPCLDDNNVPCLYDTISETTLYNQGTGTCGYEIEPQPTEIWSCGDLGQDGRYHVKISNGVTVYDIPLDAPLRKVNDVADTIEFPSDTEGKALVTRNFSFILIGNASISSGNTNITDVKRKQFNDITAKPTTSANDVANILCCVFKAKSANSTYTRNKGISVDPSGRIQIYDPDYNTASDINDFKAAYADVEVIYELTTPTTELVDAPQIQEADSYSMVISQGGKAVSWSSFEIE